MKTACRLKGHIEAQPIGGRTDQYATHKTTIHASPLCFAYSESAHDIPAVCAGEYRVPGVVLSILSRASCTIFHSCPTYLSPHLEFSNLLYLPIRLYILFTIVPRPAGSYVMPTLPTSGAAIVRALPALHRRSRPFAPLTRRRSFSWVTCSRDRD